MATKDNAGKSAVANGRGKWNVPTGRRTDEWSEALVLVGESQDRAAFTRFFRHFAPLIKAFALSGSSLSATHADELVQEVMLKVWQKAGGFNPEKAAASTWVYTIARNCRTDMFRRLQKFDTALASDDLSWRARRRSLSLCCTPAAEPSESGSYLETCPPIRRKS